MTTFEGYRPLVRDADVVLLGFRDVEEAATYGSQIPPPEMRAIDLTEVRRSGVDAVAHEVVDRLSRPWLSGFWIHLDADALDDAVMPAVDYRLPDGLSWQELHAILRTALNSPRAVGFEMTIFNPALDHDGTIARSLVDALVTSITRKRKASHQADSAAESSGLPRLFTPRITAISAKIREPISEGRAWLSRWLDSRERWADQAHRTCEIDHDFDIRMREDRG